MPLPQSRTVRAGLVLFAAGLVFIAADFLGFAFGDSNTPLWVNLGCVLAPVGFGIAVWSALRAGRDEQRRALAELTRPPAGS